MRSTARVRSVEVAKQIEIVLVGDSKEYAELPVPSVWLECALREGGYRESQVDAVMNLIGSISTSVSSILKKGVCDEPVRSSEGN